MQKTYPGSCHCGVVRFEADLDLTQNTYRCNCSICRRTRFWPAVATEAGFRLLAGESELTPYLRNTRKNQHFFCKHCGVRAFGVGTDTPIGKMVGVNLGCLNDVSDEALSRADHARRWSQRHMADCAGVLCPPVGSTVRAGRRLHLEQNFSMGRTTCRRIHEGAAWRERGGDRAH